METRTVIIAAATQFLAILGFTIVMPIATDIAIDLDLPLSHLGLLAASYALAGVCTGLFSANLLDRYGRRTPLITALGLLGLANIGASLAESLPFLMVMRAIAGGAGGICTAMLTAIIGDTVAKERRGRAFALVLGTGPLVSILGLPLAIELAAIASWRLPLLLLGSVTLMVMMMARLGLPPLSSHLDNDPRPSQFLLRHTPRRGSFYLAFGGMFAMTIAFGLLTANNAPLLLMNLHLPRSWLATFYMCCGVVTLISLRLVGRISDSRGPLVMILPATIAFSVGIFLSYVLPLGYISGIAAMACTIMSISILSVTMTTLALRAPETRERAGFGALLGALQNLASATGAGLSSLILIDLPGPRLGNAHYVGLLSIAAASTLPLLAAMLQRRLRSAIEAEPARQSPSSTHPVL